ncbi:MAG: HAD family hydrolase [Candidatus Bathyarchaeota archaeon]|nr:HAD family hydrolase [Candidatus Bathyarchaeota archaeon]
MTIKAVIFDLDGTITVFNLDYKRTRGEVRSYLLNAGIPDSMLKMNEGVFEMLKKAEIYLAHKGKPTNASKVRKDVLKIIETYEFEAAKQTSLLSGTLETLKTLRHSDLKIGLCTINSEKSTTYLLERFKLQEYFDAIASRDDVEKVKPSPDHLQAVIKKLNVTPKETVVVGDSINDMQGAKELNAIAVGLTSGVSTQKQLITYGAHYIITSITDLPILIERLNKFEPNLSDEGPC